MEILSTFCANSPFLPAIGLMAFYVLSTLLFIAGTISKDWFNSGHSNLKLIGSNALFSVLAIAGIILLQKEMLITGVIFLVLAYCLMLIRFGVQAAMSTDDQNY